jgi:hypothetical protein
MWITTFPPRRAGVVWQTCSCGRAADARRGAPARHVCRADHRREAADRAFGFEVDLYTPPVGATAVALIGLFSILVVLMGCGRDRFDPHGPEVTRHRDTHVTAVTTAVDRIFEGLPGYGDGRNDSCEAGQNNGKVNDGYRMRCAFYLRALAGMRAATIPAAIAEALQHLHDAGCSGGQGSTDPRHIWFYGDALDPAPLWGGLFMCAGAEVSMYIGRSADPTLVAQVGVDLPGPAGITVTEKKLDAEAVLAAASRDGHEFVLIADAGDDYYHEPL